MFSLKSLGRSGQGRIGEMDVPSNNPFWAPKRCLNHILDNNDVDERDPVVRTVIGYALLLASRQIDKEYNQRAGALIAISPVYDLVNLTRPCDGERAVDHGFHLREMKLEGLSIYEHERMSELLKKIYDLELEGEDLLAIGVVSDDGVHNSRQYQPGDVFGTRLRLLENPDAEYTPITDERIGLKHRAGGEFSTNGDDVIIVSQAYPGMVTHYRAGDIVKRYKPQVSEYENELRLALWAMPKEGIINGALVNYIAPLYEAEEQPEKPTYL